MDVCICSRVADFTKRMMKLCYEKNMKQLNTYNSLKVALDWFPCDLDKQKMNW